MDAMSLVGSVSSPNPEVGTKLLKKAQDMAKGEMKLLDSLPSPAKSANAPGQGAKVDFTA